MNSHIHSLVERIRKNQPVPWGIGSVLSAATPIIRFGMWLRLRQPRVRVPARVISFGNLTAGGTGKTPATIARAQEEIAAGRKVAVLTRGYGSKPGSRPLVVSGKHDVAEWCRLLGDEGALVARKVPEAIIVKCIDRVAAAQAAIREYGCHTLILDDGFQHVRLERDENILLVDATNPFGSGHLLPRGILREPLRGILRATEIWVTRSDQARDLPSLLASLKMFHPSAPIRRTYHAPKGLWRLRDDAPAPVSELRRGNVTVVCAIANPDGFMGTLESLGAVIGEQRCFIDHAEIPRSALNSKGMVVTTEKDAMRLLAAIPAAEIPENVVALEIEIRDFESR